MMEIKLLLYCWCSVDVTDMHSCCIGLLLLLYIPELIFRSILRLLIRAGSNVSG